MIKNFGLLRKLSENDMGNLFKYSLTESTKRSVLVAAACLALSSGFVAEAGAAAAPTSAVSKTAPALRTDIIAAQTVTKPLLGHSNKIVKLTGTNPRYRYDFSLRRDEIVSKAELKLSYTPSPSLIPVWSQLNVYLNGQMQKSIPIEKTDLGESNELTLKINPRLIKDNNLIEVEFVGTSSRVCVAPSSNTLWMTVNNESALQMNVQKIRVASDLSFFPLPFIDTNAARENVLPFVFSGKSVRDHTVKEAAAVLASWFGAKSAWRGTHFPVYFDEQPGDGHYVAMITNEDRPVFLKDFPPVSGPELRVIDAPYSQYGKVLVIAGRNTDDLLIAVRALAAGQVVMTGDTAKINPNMPLPPKRKAYDAPRWIDTSKITYFDELMEYRGQFASKGVQPPPVYMNLNLPPDLFIFNQSHVNLDLKYRYTQPVEKMPSQLRFYLNEQLIESYKLNPDNDKDGIIAHLPVVNSLKELLNVRSVPMIVLSDDNTMKFDFQYSNAYPIGTEQDCKAVTLIENHVEIDPASSIDLTGLYHFTELPDLRMFAKSGFPFTKYADLSETVVVMPEASTQTNMTTLLNVMGRIGANTGLAASRVQIADNVAHQTLSDKDVLIIGALPKNTPEVSGDYIYTLLDTVRASVDPKRKNAEKAPQKTVAPDTEVITDSVGVGVVIGFESPFTEQRSVVAMLSDSDKGGRVLNNAVRYPGTFAQMKGAASVVRETGVTAYEIGATYEVGHLPWHQRVWITMLERPLLLMLCAALCALIFGTCIYGLMRMRVKARGHE